MLNRANVRLLVKILFLRIVIAIWRMLIDRRSKVMGSMCCRISIQHSPDPRVAREPRGKRWEHSRWPCDVHRDHLISVSFDLFSERWRSVGCLGSRLMWFDCRGDSELWPSGRREVVRGDGWNRGIGPTVSPPMPLKSFRCSFLRPPMKLRSSSAFQSPTSR